jgi:hypothetical protein
MSNHQLVSLLHYLEHLLTGCPDVPLLLHVARFPARLLDGVSAERYDNPQVREPPSLD